jgi:S-sulfo-L-cysteine synthase (O-acetyl-L-serine-dependent)
MDWNVPCYCRLPDPILEIAIDDFHVPVIVLPDELLSKRLRGQNIRVYALLGFVAPPGNIKRIPASYMLKRAVETGLIKPGGTLVEPTSGNMGVSLAYCAKAYGIKVVAIVADAMPTGKLLPLRRHGAEIVKESEARAFIEDRRVQSSVELARRYADAIGGVFLNQYGNPWNPEAYETLVAPALWDGIKGRAAMFVSSVGSTGTLLGLGAYFKRRRPDMEIIATMPYIGQSIDGTRDFERLQEITHAWKALSPIVEPIDERTARAISNHLNESGIPGGPSSGAAFGSAEHCLLNRLGDHTLEALRSDDGTIGVIVPFSDTLYPYG